MSKSVPVRCPEVIRYLEETLARARRGEVLFFLGSAGCLNGNELEVLVGAGMSAGVQLLDEDSLRATYASTAKGIADATAKTYEGLQNELDSRNLKPKIIL